jgi:hypothetical protein
MSKGSASQANHLALTSHLPSDILPRSVVFEQRLGKHIRQSYHVWSWPHPLKNFIPIPNHFPITRLHHIPRRDNQVLFPLINISIRLLDSRYSFFVFPDNPTKCKFLSNEDKMIAVEVTISDADLTVSKHSCLSSACEPTTKVLKINRSSHIKHWR